MRCCRLNPTTKFNILQCDTTVLLFLQAAAPHSLSEGTGRIPAKQDNGKITLPPPFPLPGHSRQQSKQNYTPNLDSVLLALLLQNFLQVTAQDLFIC